MVALRARKGGSVQNKGGCVTADISGYELELGSRDFDIIFSLFSLRPCRFSLDQFFGPEEKHQILKFDYFSTLTSPLPLKIDYINQNMMINDFMK